MRRRARPTTCSQSNCVPKARTPRTWVTVLASQPSVSMETLTTHLTCSPSLPALPTVFITSRSRSSSVRLSASRPGKRARYSALNSSISRAAIFLKSSLIASPDSSCWLSTRIVLGRCSQPPRPSSLRKIGQLPGLDDGLVADRLFPAGDDIEHQLRDVGVVADDDEHRRRDAAGAGLGVLLPEAVILFVVAVEAVQGPLQLDRELGFAARPLRSCALSWAGPRGCAATGRGRWAARRSSNRRPPARAAP